VGVRTELLVGATIYLYSRLGVQCGEYRTSSDSKLMLWIRGKKQQFAGDGNVERTSLGV